MKIRGEVKQGTYEKKLQNILDSKLPVVSAMGIHIVKYTRDSLEVAAPLEKNVNHMATAFGGSIFSVAVLSGWGLIYLRLQDEGLDGHIVIQESKIKYIKAVDTTIRAKCVLESESKFERFLKCYKKMGMARLKLESRIFLGDEEIVHFQGKFVVFK